MTSRWTAFALVLCLNLVLEGASQPIAAVWSSFSETEANGSINGISIVATTTSSAPFVGLPVDRMYGPLWNTETNLAEGSNSVVASDVNQNDAQSFSFSASVSDLLLYIENFDSSSVAQIQSDSALGISVVEASPSIDYDVFAGVLSTTNATFDGEGDVILRLGGATSTVSLTYSAGSGSNGVFYSFAMLPEPTGFALLASAVLLGAGRLRRRRA